MQRMWNIVDGPSKYDLLAALGVGQTNRPGRRLSVILHFTNSTSCHVYVDQLGRRMTKADEAHEDIMQKAADIWHFVGYVTDSHWPHHRKVEGIYATDIRHGRLFFKDKLAG